MHEYVLNLHLHTKYSKGHAHHSEIVEVACAAGLDAIIITDSNVLVNGPAGYWSVPGEDGDRSVLVIIGEEVYDQAILPQKNHLLIIGTDKEFSTLAYAPQQLIDSVRQSGGLTFLAHPFDREAPKINQDDFSWTAWDVNGFNGMEIWNGFSEFKSRITGRLKAQYYACDPKAILRGPFPETLNKWDELLSAGRRIVAVGGSNVYPRRFAIGPFEWTNFPYEFHFEGINTHILTPDPLKGDAITDQELILDALRRGNTFVGYDLLASTRGFRFNVHSLDGISCMGDEVLLDKGVTLQIRLPQPEETYLIKDGKLIKRLTNRKTYSYNVTEPGVFRVEAFKNFRGRRRGWIYSNPIYIR
ncbi:MAG: hypothetical protein FVQ83_02675 [Chloroflexi bacterium]|nr:hypothetical protein [Chloroflexota bacterium]